MRFAFLTFAFSLVFILGCAAGDPHNRQAVKGKVTYDGKVIPSGNIEFVPAEGQKVNGITEISNSEFSISKDKGLSPGKYTVRVQGFDGPVPQLKPGEDPGSANLKMPKSMVPEKYNSASQETVTIVAGKVNEITIDLKK